MCTLRYAGGNPFLCLECFKTRHVDACGMYLACEHMASDKPLQRLGSCPGPNAQLPKPDIVRSETAQTEQDTTPTNSTEQCVKKRRMHTTPTNVKDSSLASLALQDDHDVGLPMSPRTAMLFTDEDPVSALQPTVGVHGLQSMGRGTYISPLDPSCDAIIDQRIKEICEAEGTGISDFWGGALDAVTPIDLNGTGATRWEDGGEPSTVILANKLAQMQRQSAAMANSNAAVIARISPEASMMAVNKIHYKISLLCQQYWKDIDKQTSTLTSAKDTATEIYRVRYLALAVKTALRFVSQAYPVDEATDADISDLNVVCAAAFVISMKKEGHEIIKNAFCDNDIDEWTAKHIVNTYFVTTTQSWKVCQKQIAHYEVAIMASTAWRIQFTVLDAVEELCNCLPERERSLILPMAFDFVQGHCSSEPFQLIPHHVLGILLFQNLCAAHCPTEAADILQTVAVTTITRTQQSEDYRQSFDTYFLAFCS